MKTRVIVTERDAKLLYDCYSHVSLSIDQIRRRHFPEVSKAAATNRLSRLKRAGLLRTFPIGTVLYQGKPKRIGVVYQVTKTAIHRLRERFPRRIFRDEPVRLSTLSLSHDLLLTEALTALEKRFPGGRIIVGFFLDKEKAGKRLPDALIVDYEGNVLLAIELEMTVKSKVIYRQIIVSYMLSPQYPRVLYIAGSKAVFDRVKYQVTERKEIPGLPPPSTGKFFFCHLGELLANPTTARITNNTADLRLS